MQWSISIKDWLLILCLAVLCTSIAYSMELTALKTISAFKANLIINLEPIYGMLLAAVIFNEYKELNVWFYLGAAIILMSVFAHPLLVSKTKGDGKNA